VLLDISHYRESFIRKIDLFQQIKVTTRHNQLYKVLHREIDLSQQNKLLLEITNGRESYIRKIDLFQQIKVTTQHN
jgi:hypothetical protein